MNCFASVNRLNSTATQAGVFVEKRCDSSKNLRKLGEGWNNGRNRYQGSRRVGKRQNSLKTPEQSVQKITFEEERPQDDSTHMSYEGEILRGVSY